MIQGTAIDHSFFASAGADAGAARRTAAPVTRESEGLTITLSDGVMPSRISILMPKSRPTLMLRNSTVLSGLTTPTYKPSARKIKVLFGRVSILPNEAGERRASA